MKETMKMKKKLCNEINELALSMWKDSLDNLKILGNLEIECSLGKDGKYDEREFNLKLCEISRRQYNEGTVVVHSRIIDVIRTTPGKCIVKCFAAARINISPLESIYYTEIEGHEPILFFK